MAIEFQSINKNLDNIIKEVIEETDLVVEGGAGTNMWPCTGFKKLGYEGPYIRMDLTFVGEAFEPSKYTSQKDGTVTEWWPCYGNCFLMEDMKHVIDKFNPKNPLFVTSNSLSNALFSKEMVPGERKSDRDRISFSEAAGFLNKIYKKQLHINPGIFSIVSKDYAEKHKDELNGISKEEIYPNLIILNKTGSDLGLYELKNFIEENAKMNWDFYLSSEEDDILYMKKTFFLQSLKT